MTELLDPKMFRVHVAGAKAKIHLAKQYRHKAIAVGKEVFDNVADNFLIEAEEQVAMAELYMVE